MPRAAEVVVAVSSDKVIGGLFAGLDEGTMRL